MPSPGTKVDVNTSIIANDLLREFCIAVVKRFAEDLATKTQEASEIGAKLNEASDKSKSDGELLILDAESDGVNCIRYAKEVSSLQKVFASNSSDYEVKAIASQVLNKGAENFVEIVCETPLMSLYQRRKHSQRCQVVDLTSVPDVVRILDAAVQSVADGGILLVAFSDPALFSAADPAACYRRYGATNVDGSPESALRVALAALELHANRHGRVAVPTAYKRSGDRLVVCVKLFIGPVRCKQSLSKTSLVFRCEKCETSTLHALGAAELISEKPQRFKFSLPRGPPVPALCQRCQQPHQVGGPVWNADVEDVEFTSRLVPLTVGDSSGAAV